MADEIAQVCELEIQGVKMVVKATVAAAQMLMRMLRAVFNLGSEQIEKGKEVKLNKAGLKTTGQILQLSQGGAPEIFTVREDMMELLMAQCEKQGLHFALPVDFIPNDGMSPFMVPAQEAAIVAAIYKALLANQIVEDEKVVNSYDRSIAELEEKLLNISPEAKEEIDKLHTQIENYKQAKEEAAKWVSYDEEVINAEDVSISLMDYIKQSKGTSFEENPEKAMAEYEKGVEIGQKFSAKECFQPIRDKSYMPDTRLTFYVPDNGSIVTRTFHLDEETGLVYSKYALKTEAGEKYEYTDRGKTKDKWNAEFLPDLLDKAGVIEGTQCRMFDTQEKLLAYVNYHNQVKPKSEIEIEKAIKEGSPVFSSAESKKEIEHAISEIEKGLASARINNERITIAVEPHMVTRQGGKLYLRLENGDTLMFGRSLDERIEKGKAVWDIEKDDIISCLKNNQKASDTPQLITLSGVECKELMDQINAEQHAPVNTQKHGR